MDESVKDYIRSEYKVALSDYAVANSDDKKHSALRELSRLEKLACQKFGFAFADQLIKEKEKMRCQR